MPCQYRAVPAVVSCALSRTRKKAQSSTKCISAGALQGTMRIRYLDWAAPLPDAGCAGAACEAEDTGDAAALAGAPDPGSAERVAAAGAAPVEPGMPPAVGPSERFETIIASDVLYEVWPPLP